MDTFDTSNCSRTNLKMILSFLDSKDISYDFDGNAERLTFDITELSEKAQREIENHLRRVNESKIKSYIKKVIKEEISRIREGQTSGQEIKDIALDLIDYLGGELPANGWSKNSRIMNYFRDLGYKDNDPMIHKIYNTALRLNK